MMRLSVELTSDQVRGIIARHIQDMYDSRCRPEDIRFRVKMGYNGEMGGETTPSEAGVFWEIDTSTPPQQGGR